MLRALWFFAQLAVVVCAGVWIAMQKGSVDLVWNNYSFSLNLGLFLLFLTVFTLAVVLFFRLIGMVLNVPASMTRRRKERNRQKGFSALTRGFVAIAAGDSKKATALARDVRYLLPHETGLPLLLEAQAARLRGDERAAQASFEQLLGDKDAAFFGIRGLVKSSLDVGDTQKALSYARTALEQNPKQPWILKSVYDLEIQSHQWEDAYRTLQKLSKHKVVDTNKIISDEIALLMILAQNDMASGNESGWKNKVERAHKLDATFVPAITALGHYWIERGKAGKVSSMVEKAWRITPHPDLALLWDKVSPMPKASDPLRRLRWFEKLMAINPDSADGKLAAAKVAMECGLNGQAREYLESALEIRPTVQAYRLFADLEEQTTHNALKVREWLEKAAQAAPDAVWYCSQTGVMYDHWAGVALPHGAFNSIVWGHPLNHNFYHQETLMKDWQDPLLIENN